MEDIDNASSTVKGWKARFLTGDLSGETWIFFGKRLFYQSIPGCTEDIIQTHSSVLWRSWGMPLLPLMTFG